MLEFKVQSVLPLLVALVLLANVALCSQHDPEEEDKEEEEDGDEDEDEDILPGFVKSSVIEQGQYPFLVSIDGRCGGAILSSRLIITTAKCVEAYIHGEQPLGLDQMSVFIGEHHLCQLDGERQVSIESVRAHEDYNMTDDGSRALVPSDIALLKTREEMPLDDSNKIGATGRIRLNHKLVRPGDSIIAVGWPFFDRSVLEVSDFLDEPAELAVTKLSADDCGKILEQHNLALARGSLCAGRTKEAGHFCTNAGSVLFRSRDEKYELVGLSSVCFPQDSITVYTSVGKHLGWLLKTIASLQDNDE